MAVPLSGLRFLSAANDETDRRSATPASLNTGRRVPTLVVPPLDERHLIERIQGGDAAALEHIFAEYSDRLVAFAAHLLASGALAEEVVSDVFLWIWRHRETWRPEVALARYLYRAVRNRAQNVLRGARRESVLLETLATGGEMAGMGEPAGSADQALEHAEQLAVLQRAVDQLPAATRTVLELRWRQSMSYEDIADVLGMSAVAARMQVSRAIKRLRAAVPEAF